MILYFNIIVYFKSKRYKNEKKSNRFKHTYKTKTKTKTKTKQNKLTQPELALKAGVGLRFLRDLEQGKNSLRIDKVNDVLKLFGETLGAVPINRENY